MSYPDQSKYGLVASITLISILLILLAVFIKWSAQIEAPFETETFETVKIIVLGLFMIVMAGVVVATMIWKK